MPASFFFKRIAPMLCVSWIALSGAAFAQKYPDRPVRIVVPFATGGPADNYARFMAQRLSDALGQSFVVDNRPGAGSLIGTDVVAKAAPDGYTLLMMSNTQTVNETLIPNKPFALMKDFVGVAPINYSDLVLVDRAIRPRSGQVVIAVVDGEFVCKTLLMRAGRVRLKAANPTFADIEPRDGQSLDIWGVVVAAIKQFRV